MISLLPLLWACASPPPPPPAGHVWESLDPLPSSAVSGGGLSAGGSTVSGLVMRGQTLAWIDAELGRIGLVAGGQRQWIPLPAGEWSDLDESPLLLDREGTVWFALRGGAGLRVFRAQALGGVDEPGFADGFGGPGLGNGGTLVEDALGRITLARRMGERLGAWRFAGDTWTELFAGPVAGLNANGPEADLAPTLAAAPGGGLVLALRHRQQVRWRKGENEAILTRGEGDVRFPIAVALLGDEGLRWLAAPRRSPLLDDPRRTDPRLREDDALSQGLWRAWEQDVERARPALLVEEDGAIRVAWTSGSALWMQRFDGRRWSPVPLPLAPGRHRRDLGLLAVEGGLRLTFAERADSEGFALRAFDLTEAGLVDLGVVDGTLTDSTAPVALADALAWVEHTGGADEVYLRAGGAAGFGDPAPVALLEGLGAADQPVLRSDGAGGLLLGFVERRGAWSQHRRLARPLGGDWSEIGATPLPLGVAGVDFLRRGSDLALGWSARGPWGPRVGLRLGPDLNPAAALRLDEAGDQLRMAATPEGLVAIWRGPAGDWQGRLFGPSGEQALTLPEGASIGLADDGDLIVHPGGDAAVWRGHFTGSGWVLAAEGRCAVEDIGSVEVIGGSSLVMAGLIGAEGQGALCPVEGGGEPLLVELSRGGSRHFFDAAAGAGLVLSVGSGLSYGEGLSLEGLEPIPCEGRCSQPSLLATPLGPCVAYIAAGSRGDRAAVACRRDL